MDYIFASILSHHDPDLHKVISYDIACQWTKNLSDRLPELPVSIRPTDIGSMEAVIPKLHVYSHNPPCPTDYSFNFLEGAGRTDGEGIERTHSNTGPVCASTKQMGPGYRHDAMDAHWMFWNWRKIVGMGEFFCLQLATPALIRYLTGLSLYTKLLTAYLEVRDHRERFERFSELQLADVPQWEAMVIAWERDHSQPNPYVVTKTGTCERVLSKPSIHAYNKFKACPKPTSSLHLQHKRRSSQRRALPAYMTGSTRALSL